MARAMEVTLWDVHMISTNSMEAILIRVAHQSEIIAEEIARSARPGFMVVRMDAVDKTYVCGM